MVMKNLKKRNEIKEIPGSHLPKTRASCGSIMRGVKKIANHTARPLSRVWQKKESQKYGT